MNLSRWGNILSLNDHVRRIWNRIERVLQAHVPETAKTLAPPATDDEIDVLEKSLGLRLPDSFRASLLVHNGQNDPTRCHDFSGEGLFLSTTEIVEMWKMNSEIDEQFRQQEPETWNSREFDTEWWNKNWIPFTQNDMGGLCISLEPKLFERIGEVVAFVHDSSHEPKISPSFIDWLEGLAARLERDEFRVQDGLLFLNSPYE